MHLQSLRVEHLSYEKVPGKEYEGLYQYTFTREPLTRFNEGISYRIGKFIHHFMKPAYHGILLDI